MTYSDIRKEFKQEIGLDPFKNQNDYITWLEEKHINMANSRNDTSLDIGSFKLTNESVFKTFKK